MKTLPNTFLLTILLKKKQFTVFSILDQTHRLTPSKIFDVCDLSKINFYSLKLVVYRLKHYQYISFHYFVQKETVYSFPIFDQNHGLTPLKNSNFATIQKFALCSL